RVSVRDLSGSLRKRPPFPGCVRASAAVPSNSSANWPESSWWSTVLVKQALKWIQGGQGPVSVQPAIPHVQPDKLRVGDGPCRLVLCVARLHVQDQRSSPGDHRRAERGSPASRVQTERIRRNNSLAWRGHPNNLISVIRKARPLVLVVRRSNSHDVLQARGIDHFVCAIVAGRGH